MPNIDIFSLLLLLLLLLGSFLPLQSFTSGGF